MAHAAGPIWNQNYVTSTFSCNPAYTFNHIGGLNYGIFNTQDYQNPNIPYHTAVLAHGALLSNDPDYEMDMDDIEMISCGCMGGINIPPHHDPQGEYLNNIRSYISIVPNAPAYNTDGCHERGPGQAPADDLYDVCNNKNLPTTFVKAYDYVETHINFLKNEYDIKSRLERLVNMTVSLCKTGTITTHFAKKIASGIENDLGKEIEVDPQFIKAFYNRYVRNITPELAQAFFENLQNWIPEHALRMLLTVQQCIDHGITGLLLVKKAMEAYPGFDWELLDFIRAGELARVEAALILYANRSYAGFTRTLGDMAGTKFKLAVYTAKHLLIEVGGETSLKKYRGGEKGPIPLIDEAIANMINNEVPVVDGRLARDGLDENQARIYDNAHDIVGRLRDLVRQQPAQNA